MTEPKTTLTIVDIPTYPLYVSIEQQLRNQAHEYAQRAQVYITQNKLDKAIGCLNKAVKKIKRADMLKLSPLEEAIYGPLMNRLSKIIADDIIKEGKL